MSDVYRSLEDGFADCLDRTMPTAEEIGRDPMVALKSMYFAGAAAALQIAYHHGFVNLRKEIAKWSGGQG